MFSFSILSHTSLFKWDEFLRPFTNTLVWTRPGTGCTCSTINGFKIISFHHAFIYTLKDLGKEKPTEMREIDGWVYNEILQEMLKNCKFRKITILVETRILAFHYFCTGMFYQSKSLMMMLNYLHKKLSFLCQGEIRWWCVEFLSPSVPWHLLIFLLLMLSLRILCLKWHTQDI